MDKKELIEIMKKHKKWTLGEEGGECANLIGADLSGAKGILSSIDFMEINFEKTKD